MCGIAGIFAFNPSTPPVARAELRATRDHMAARGPDGQGEWFSDNGRVALGHRRLAIIDLTDGGAQPMQSAGGQLVITFNGEIYNHRELRKELEARGHVFRSDSDTEVLLHLYQAKGTAMLQDLSGMYAFALWDARKQALLLARDPFGIKPLYYTPATTAQSGTLRFASQVKALLAGGQIDTAPEPAGHTGFFLWGSVPAPHTLYLGIRALPARHFMWVSGQGATAPQPFCQITDLLAHAAANPARGTRADALEAIGAAVRNSIAAHHVANVSVGILLSAGIDSALITALSSAHGERPHSQGCQDLQSSAGLDATTAHIPQDRLAVSALEMSWYMRHQLLVNSDWASMAQSLELRVPFLDMPLLRTAAPWLAAHPELTKPQVAQALAPQLPRALLHKPKTGFTIPVRDWLMGDLAKTKNRGFRDWAQHVHQLQTGAQA